MKYLLVWLFSKKCRECGAYKSHSPRCSKISKKDAIEQLHRYYDVYLRNNESVSERESRLQKKLNKYKNETEMWKGKYWSIKQENNKLRKYSNSINKK